MLWCNIIFNKEEGYSPRSKRFIIKIFRVQSFNKIWTTNIGSKIKFFHQLLKTLLLNVCVVLNISSIDLKGCQKVVKWKMQTLENIFTSVILWKMHWKVSGYSRIWHNDRGPQQILQHFLWKMKSVFSSFYCQVFGCCRCRRCNISKSTVFYLMSMSIFSMLNFCWLLSHNFNVVLHTKTWINLKKCYLESFGCIRDDS